MNRRDPARAAPPGAPAATSASDEPSGRRAAERRDQHSRRLEPAAARPARRQPGGRSSGDASAIDPVAPTPAVADANVHTARGVLGRLAPAIRGAAGLPGCPARREARPVPGRERRPRLTARAPTAQGGRENDRARREAGEHEDRLHFRCRGGLRREALADGGQAPQRHGRGRVRARLSDPACGSGGRFISSERFAEAHGGRAGDISIYGQESNHTTRRLAKRHLAIRCIDANIVHGDTFHADGPKDLQAAYVLANPPFNDSDWGQPRVEEDVRCRYGVLPAGNANFARVQHLLHHLSPTGIAGFVLANGSMSSPQAGEGDTRKAIVEADLVDCMVALTPSPHRSLGSRTTRSDRGRFAAGDSR
ncbi:MAG: N-6 DNA methylase [Polyangiaceae bacterium]|nr:N-6 DNA methylase [Polyangiaceae bacterium]